MNMSIPEIITGAHSSIHTFRELRIRCLIITCFCPPEPTGDVLHNSFGEDDWKTGSCFQHFFFFHP
jgi:hypothetical protein